MQSADNAGLRCPLKESMDAVVYVDEQRMLRSDLAGGGGWGQGEVGGKVSYVWHSTDVRA